MLFSCAVEEQAIVAPGSGRAMTKSTDNPELEEKKIKPLDEGDLDILKSYGLGPYAIPSKKLGLEINEMVEKVKKLVGVKESDTGPQ